MKILRSLTKTDNQLIGKDESNHEGRRCEKLLDNGSVELRYEIKGHVERGLIGGCKITVDSTRNVLIKIMKAWLIFPQHGSFHVFWNSCSSRNMILSLSTIQ